MPEGRDTLSRMGDLVSAGELAEAWGVDEKAIAARIGTATFAVPMTSRDGMPLFDRGTAELYRPGLQRPPVNGRLPDPPPPTPRWPTGPPDFVGVGTPRSGSTWWFDILCCHPRVTPPTSTRKELHFFAATRSGSAGDPAVLRSRYASYFPRLDGTVTGEWTPVYLYDEPTLRALATAAPQAGVLVILRDPLARLRSALNRLSQRAAERGRELDPGAAEQEIGRSLYGEHLERLLRYVPRDRLLVLQLERCLADPGGELARTAEFLGLEACRPDAAKVAARPNRRSCTHPPSAELEAAASPRLRDDAERLARRLQRDIDLSRWSELMN